MCSHRVPLLTTMTLNNLSFLVCGYCRRDDYRERGPDSEYGSGDRHDDRDDDQNGTDDL